MKLKLVFSAEVKDAEDIRGLREQIAMCFEELGDVRLISVVPVKGSMPPKVERGTYGHVMLSDGEYEKLVARFGKGKAEALISEFSYKLHQKHYRYADHFAAILKWEEEEGTHSPSVAFGDSSLPEGAFEDVSAGKAASFDVDEFFRANAERINGNGN